MALYFHYLDEQNVTFDAGEFVGKNSFQPQQYLETRNRKAASNFYGLILTEAIKSVEEMGKIFVRE